MPVSTIGNRFRRFLRVGPITMLMGAALVLAGIVQTTSSTTYCADQSCLSGTALIAKFNYDHGYVFEKPAGNEHVVTLSHASAKGATWHSTLPVSVLIIKGGDSSVFVTFASPQRDGVFDNSVLPKVGNDKNYPDISNVQFCEAIPVVTTTIQPTTTTGVPPTTVVPDVTTTAPAATTTVPPTTPSTVVSQGSTTTRSVSTSTSIVRSAGKQLPFTGGASTLLIILGVVFLAVGFVLTMFDRRRHLRSQT